MKNTQKKLVILDTHAILHRAYHALPDFSSSKGEPTGALYGIISMLVKIIKDLKPNYIVAAVDLPGGTFRDAAYEHYKAGRPETQEDLVAQIKKTPGLLEAFGIPVYSAKNFEADDVIGTIVEQLKKKKDFEIVIASGDKDALQLIDGTRVTVFTLGRGLNDTLTYDEAGVKARYGFGPEAVPDLKGIAGDPSDNIKGVRGVGEGSAMKLLQVYGNLKNLYAAIKKEGVETVSKKTGVQERFVQLVADNKEDAEFSRDLATIHRKAPIEFALPKSEWREGVDTAKALDMLAEFDFRSLMPRVRELLGTAPEAPKKKGEIVEGRASDSMFPEHTIAQSEFNAVAVAAWVLDSNITEPNLDDIYRVGKARDFETAKTHILEEIKKQKLSYVYEKIELPLMGVLRKMEQKGIRIDKAFLAALSKEYTKELNKIAARIYKAAGGEFNVNSPKQLGDVLFDKLGLLPLKQKKTAGGQRSTRESELIKMKEMHPIIEDILSYRELQKLLSTYIDTIPTLLDKNDRIHTTFIQNGAATGRLASQNPNLQNIPIKTDLGRAIRHAFVADKGYVLVSFDYSQIELRIAAFLSGDKALADIFKSGRDVHREVAARVFHVRDEEVTYEQRRRAKVINFGILYGMGVNSLREALGTTRAEAQLFYNEYFNAFPRLAAYIDEVKADAMRKGYTETHFGRRRYMEGIKSPIPYVRAAAERMAINAPMQGTQADVVKLAMIEVDKLFDKEAPGSAYQLLQVHDELIFEIEEGLAGALAPKIKEIMENVIPHKEAKGIPFKAEGKSGKNWGEMKELH